MRKRKLTIRAVAVIGVNSLFLARSVANQAIDPIDAAILFCMAILISIS